jgi:hypothetical protein
MLESAVGAVGYVIRKLNQVRENGPSSQSRFEAIEILDSWLAAKLNGKEEAAEFFERRFRDEYRLVSSPFASFS